MASGLESIPNVDVSSTDYGVQLFNRIFGEGWQNLSSLIGGSPGGDAGVTFIYHLLGTLNWIEGEWKDTGDSIVYLFAVPRTCGASQNETNLQPGDLGGFKFPKSTIGTDIDVAKQKGIVSLLNAIQPPAERLGQKNFTYTDRARIFSAGHSYTTSVANALGAVVQQSDAKRREAFQSFAEVAKSSGWLTAGSYYWALSAINGRVVEAMEDNTEYMQPNMEAVRPLLHPDWLTYAEPNLQAATTTLLLADSKDSEHLQEGRHPTACRRPWAMTPRGGTSRVFCRA